MRAAGEYSFFSRERRSLSTLEMTSLSVTRSIARLRLRTKGAEFGPRKTPGGAFPYQIKRGGSLFG
jgi:hypothetical protein